MQIKIIETALNPWKEMEDYQNTFTDLSGKFGATQIFIGTMRDFNDDDTVKAMTLEHYPNMTEHQLQKMVQIIKKRWNILDVLLIHRVGELRPNQPIVLISVWSAHRKEAFEACREIMETLKSSAPFWKKETLVEGSRWVTQNTRGSIN